MQKNLFKNTFLVTILLFLTFLYPITVYAVVSEEEKDQTIKIKDWKIIPIINLDALGTYSKIQGHDAVEGGLVDFLISPVIKINDRNYIIPFYNINYNRERQIISQEEGGRLTKETLSHNLYLTYKKNMTKNLTFKFGGLGTWTYYKETKDEGWSEGLYDYIDKGIMLDFEYTLSNPKDKIYKELGFEIEYYRRKYPNFKSLISLASPTAPEVDEKDYDGIKFTLGYLRENPSGLSLAAEYKPILKYYIDKLVIDSDGVLISGKEREDIKHAVNLNFSYPLKKRLTLSLNNQIIINRSNQNFYDSRDTIVLTDDTYTPDYYDYNSFEIKPKITYDIPINKEKDLTLTLSYSYLDRIYTDRKAQDSNGVYTGSDEEDEFHTISIGLSYPLTDKIKALCLFDYTKAESNMKYERYYRYDYDLMSIACGISCRF